MRMRPVLSAGLALALLACGEPPAKPVEPSALAAAEQSGDAGRMWPLMLKHCLSRPACDPSGDFGLGAGEASADFGSARVFVRAASADKPAEITVSLVSDFGEGGPAGRPLNMRETPSHLRSTRDRVAWLAIDLAPGEGAPKPTLATLRTMQLRLAIPETADVSTFDAASTATSDYFSSLKSDGGAGARIELTGKKGLLMSGRAVGAPAGSAPEAHPGDAALFAPWVFAASDMPGTALLSALERGEALDISVTRPDGKMILKTQVSAERYRQALAWAGDALKDESIALPLPERCAPHLDKPSAFWLSEGAKGALRPCMPPQTAPQPTPAPNPI